MAEGIPALSRIDMLDARMVPDRPEEMTPGEAGAGLSLTGLGCAKRPVVVTLPFCANHPRDPLWRAGGGAEMFHRGTLGRTLDAV